MTVMDQSAVRDQDDWRIVYLLALAIVLIVAWPTLFFPFARDQGIHATIAYALGEGLVTYSDVYNIKPPLTTAVHLLSQTLFGHSMAAIRSLDMVFAGLTTLGLVSIVRRCGLPQAAGIFTAFGFVLIYYSQSYWSNAQTDGWAGFLVVAAVLAMLSGWERPSGRARTMRMGLAGAILGIAFATKYTIGGAGILIFAPLLAGRDVRFQLMDFIAVTLGGLSFLVLLALVMLGAGALAPYFEIQGYILGYVGIASSIGALLSQTLNILPNTQTQVVIVLGALVWLWGAYKREALLFHALIPLWLFAGGLSAVVQGKGFHYHYLPLVPPYALLIGLVGWRLVEIIRRFGVGRPILPVAVLAGGLALPSEAVNWMGRGLTALTGPEPSETMLSEFPPGTDFDIAATLAFNDVLTQRREPDDRLFVWGFETMLYFLQREPPRYRYPYAWPFVVHYHDGRYTDDLITRLTEEPPRHIVVQDEDATPWVTARDQSSREFLWDFPELSAFVSERYRLVESHPRFELWEMDE
ncbi:MAG: glycosyltransferase family 39 protein [Pseudomonadota bacterium]